MFAKKVSMTRKCHNRRLQTNQWYCEEETQNILGLDCILLYMYSKISSSFLKTASIISTKVFIRTE